VIAQRDVSHGLEVRSDALSLSKGQESELEEEKNSIESGKVIGFC